ncbi:MAG: RNA polymerase sigma factor, partial [Muribaculaceae bacterium]
MKSNLTSGFERLVMEHKSTIYAVCYMFVGTRADADDLFQEVLVKLWESYGKFRGDCTVRSWVYRVSMNTCISYKRKKRLRTLPLEISPEIIDGDSTGSPNTRLDHNRIYRLQPGD